MSGSDAVWPDGAREALWQLSGDRFEFDDVAILTALEPFVQQRIAEARPVCSVCAGKGTPVSGGACICGGVGTQAAELQGFRAEVARLREDGERLNREVQVLRKVRTALIEDMRTVFDSPTADATESLQRRTRDLIDYADSWLSANFDAARSAPGGEG